MKRVLLSLVVLAFFGCTGSQNYDQTVISRPPQIASYRATDKDSFLRGFANPPLDSGPWVYWFWFDNAVVESEVRNELREIKAAGFAGVEIRMVKTIWKSAQRRQEEFTTAKTEPLSYLSPPHLKVIEAACDEAERLGLKLALNLGMGWPPGGTWIPDQHKSRRLIVQKHEVNGPSRIAGGSAIGIPENSFVVAWKKRSRDVAEVLPESFINLAASVVGSQSNTRLEWDVPTGDWVIGVFQQGYGGQLDKSDGFPADPASADAVRFHLDYIFSRLNPAIQKYYGRTLLEIASDSWEYDGRPYWSPRLPDAFEKSTGKSLLPQMYVLLDLGPGQTAIKAQLEKVESDLVRDNFFKTTTEYLNRLGLRHKPQAYGRGLERNLFAAYAASDIPESEQGRLISESVWTGRVLGKPIISMEAFTSLTRGNELFEESMGLLRSEAIKSFARGANRLQFHSFSYSPPSLGIPGWAMYSPIHLNRTVTWWRHLPLLTSWMTRVQWVLQAGDPVSDVLVYPVPSSPADGPFDQRDASRYPNSPVNMVDGANFETLTEPDFLSSGNHYRVRNVVLTAGIETDQELVSLEHLLRGGSRVITQMPPDAWPVFSQGLESRRSTLATFIQYLESKQIVVDKKNWDQVGPQLQSVTWKSGAGQLQYVHRRIDDMEIYVLVNGDGTRMFKGEVSFPHAKAIPLELDPDTGKEIRLATYRASAPGLEIPILMDPGELRILVFSPATSENHVVKTAIADVRKEGGSFIGEVISSGRYQAEFADGKSWNATVAVPEPREVKGNWLLRTSSFDNLGLNHPFERLLTRLVPWQEIEGLETFAGTLQYEIDFQVPESFLTDSDRIDIELQNVWTQGEVFLNGVRAGVAWHSPFSQEVTGLLQKGNNHLRIDVTNVLKNYRPPHVEEGADAKPRVKHRMGLLGPVRLVPKRSLLISPLEAR